MYRRALLAVSLVLCRIECLLAWDNDYDAPLRIECPSTEAVYRIRSEHDNEKEDRRWYFGCRHLAMLMEGQQCEWFYTVNTHDQILDFTCPSGTVITGVGSVHDSVPEDRIWDYRCCGADTSRLCEHRNTALSRYINEYDSYIDWQTEHAITGFYSFHNNDAEDRRWKVRTAGLECGSVCSCPVTFSDDWEIIDVTYTLNQFDLTGEQDVTLATRTINNPSATATASSDFSVSQTVTETSTYSHFVGVSITAGAEFTAKVPFIGESTLTLELSTSYIHTWGSETSTSRTVTSSFTVTVPPMGQVRATGIMSRSIIENVPYTMFLRHKALDCECISEGMWNGVQHHNLHLSVEDISETSTTSEAGTNTTSEREQSVGSTAAADGTGRGPIAVFSAIGMVLVKLGLVSLPRLK